TLLRVLRLFFLVVCFLLLVVEVVLVFRVVVREIVVIILVVIVLEIVLVLEIVVIIVIVVVFEILVLVDRSHVDDLIVVGPWPSAEPCHERLLWAAAALDLRGESRYCWTPFGGIIANGFFVSTPFWRRSSGGRAGVS